MDEDELRLAVLGLAVEASSLSGGCTHEVLPEAEAAIARLMRFLAIEGITGQEAAIGRDIARVR